MALIYSPESVLLETISSTSATSILTGEKWSKSQRAKRLDDQLSLHIPNKKLIELAYSDINKGIRVDNQNVFTNSEFAKQIFGTSPVVNLTSVDVGEIWILLRLLARGILEKIEFFYCTPQNYKGAGVGKKSKSEPLYTSLGNWSGLPELATEWNLDDLSFRQYSALGFDLYRLGSIDSYEGFPDHQEEVLILADPPTSPYWIERSLRENHALIKRVNMEAKSDCETILRVPGICPSAAASLLTDKFQKAAAERWCILPLGPRVLSLGILMFVSNSLERDTQSSAEPKVGVLYDFPEPIADETEMDIDAEYVWRYTLKGFK